MIQQMFGAVLPVTFWGSVLIAALLVLRKVGQNHISPRFFRLAFLVVALRLAVPVDLSLPDAPVHLSVPSAWTACAPVSQPLPPTAVNAEGKFWQPRYGTEDTLMHGGPESYPSQVIPVQPVRQSDGWKVQLSVLVPLLWMLGAVAVLGTEMFTYGRFQYKLHRSRRVADEQLHAMAKKHFGYPVRVYLMEDLPGPMLAGIVRPAVYLPVQEAAGMNLEYILAHEACHARRCDIVGQFVLIAARAVHWFNPLVHVMAKAAQQDMELACDEAVLQDQPVAYRQAYGRAVIANLARARRAQTLSTGFSGGKENVKRRFEQMFETKQKKRAVPLLLMIVLVVVAASSLVACGADSVPDSQMVSSVQTRANSMPDRALPDSAVQADPANVESGEEWVWPVPEYTYVSRWESEHHFGVDICAEKDTPIVAAHCGTVVDAYSGGPRPGEEASQILPEYKEVPQPGDPNYEEFVKKQWGLYVTIQCPDGTECTYAHCSSVDVKLGDQIEKGQCIAKVGSTGVSTGNHLHFQVARDDQVLDSRKEIWHHEEDGTWCRNGKETDQKDELEPFCVQDAPCLTSSRSTENTPCSPDSDYRLQQSCRSNHRHNRYC